MSYSLDSKKWTKVAERPQGLTTRLGIQGVAHPNNGLVYIPSGRNIIDGDMMIFDLQTQATKWAPMPPRESGTTLQWYGYSFVWSSYRDKFLIFGGGGNAAPYFYEYSVMSNHWTELAMEGERPPRLKNACLIPAYNGTKMILFGGLASGGNSVGSLYMLDVQSLAWNLTATAPSGQGRHSMACSVSGDNVIIWGGESTEKVKISGTPLIYNIYTANWSTQFTRGTHFTPTGPLSAKSTGMSEESESRTSSSDIGGAIAASAVVVAFVGFLFYRRRKRQRALKNGGLFAQMPESDMSLNHIVSPPPLPIAVTPGQGDLAELNSSSHVGHQRLHGSHSNAQPISLAQHQVVGDNNVLCNNNYNDMDSRPLHFRPISTAHNTDPSWITPPQNPDWPTSPQLPHSSPHFQQTSSSPSSSSSRATKLAPLISPTAPPPPYLPSGASSPLVVFRKEAITEPVPITSVRKDTKPEFLATHTYSVNNNVTNSSSSNSNTSGYAYHERQVEELQHQLAARKEELVRQNSYNRVQYYPPPLADTGSGGRYTASKAVARNPQGAGDLIVQEPGTSGNTAGDTSKEELQQQVQALQAELNRLQTLIGS
ncbi:hypothetical protein BGZ96_000831 [Linnemannia gamsii]|uniref:Galactose oxidase n=1 Tax=Linnemannia gamsii TaxID=64522 RepID=A0ABQ7JNF5_9FUNG|nr:hypothetical protein BGZ96_000831 [Linnemannia gamsii]